MWKVFSAFTIMQSVKYTDAMSARSRLLESESKMMLGWDIKLNENETKANEIIMNLKRQDLSGSSKGFKFDASKHFFDYKDEVKTSPLFKILQKMPKGAVLHAHDTGLLSPDYVVELTYHPNLYVCFDENDIKFLFSRDMPNTPCGSNWQEMQEARESSENLYDFNAKLRKHFTIARPDYKNVYTDVNAVWKLFQHYFIVTSPLFTYKPIWEKYFYDVLATFRNDNVMYIEIRSVLPHLYDLEGNVYDSVETAKSYERVLHKFMKDYPDFLGAKLIYAPLRKVEKKTVEEYIEVARKLKEELPDFFIGFDLVGQEDLGIPIKDFLNILSEAADDISFFFHAGETNQCGTSSDENLVDAIVLGAKRIGHGFALIKHPLLMKEVKNRGIAIEVNVLSNAVLKLVDDVRNHPLASYLAQNMPVVISSDDPGVWEAEPLTHDFYVTFVGVASQHADLKLLKKLALNSLDYSSHDNKDKLVQEFVTRWEKFINIILRDCV